VISVSVCLSVCEHIQTSQNFLCMLPIAVVPSSYGSTAVSYVLPVLWMILRFPVLGPMALAIQVKHQLTVTYLGWSLVSTIVLFFSFFFHFV